MQIVIDTHKFVKFLSEEKHFTQKQAEVLIEAATEYHNAYTKELATKQDLEALRKDVKGEIQSIKKDMILLKNDIIIKISGVMFALLITFKMFDKFF